MVRLMILGAMLMDISSWMSSLQASQSTKREKQFHWDKIIIVLVAGTVTLVSFTEQ